jgi:hypothetical protein
MPPTCYNSAGNRAAELAYAFSLAATHAAASTAPAATAGPARANLPAAMDTNHVFKALPCMSCLDWRSDRCKTVVGAVFLALQTGKPLQHVPTLDEALRGCCRHGLDADGPTRTHVFAAERPR